MTQTPQGYFYPGQYTGPGNYSANPGPTQDNSSIFGDFNPGPQPFLGGSPMALDAYLKTQQGTQSGLQAAAANYGNSFAQPQIDATQTNALAAQGQQAYGQGQAAYGQMGQATGLAAAAANGQAPSQAALQQSAGVAQAQRAGLSAAASTRGGAAMQAVAGQQAAQNAGQMQAQAVNAGMQNRAAEMATARGQYLGATQAQAAQAGQNTQMSLAQQAQAAQQAQFGTNTSLAARGQNEQYGLGLGQQALGYGQLGLSAQQSQLGAQTAQNQQNLQAEQAANTANQNFATGITGALGGVLGAISDIRAKQNVQPAAGGQPARAPTGPDSLQVAPQAATQIAPPATVAAPQATQPAAPQVYGMTKDQAMAFLKGQPMQPQPWQVQVGQPIMDAQQPVTSDERTKTGAHEAQHVADAYLDKLAQSAATYSYKDPSQAPAQREPGAKFGGVMAQDLQKVPEIGHQLVSDTPQGKALEGGANLSAALMGLGRLHERLKMLEARGAAR